MPNRTPYNRAPCGRSFAEEQLSGFIDKALSQADAQRVRLHLEDCADCRQDVETLRALRNAAASTEFVLPRDEQWNELPKTRPSRWLRTGGWTSLILWFLALTSFLTWQLATGPETLLEKLLVFGAVLGVILLFLSVLLDRLRHLPGDRYRRVHK
ncbi:MAG: zf-HC2 domain-containing protein [Acidobacteriota bacterium]